MSHTVSFSSNKFRIFSHTKSLNNDFLQIIDIDKSWFKLVEVVYSATYWKFNEKIEDDFSLQIHAEKTLTASGLAPSTRRHTDSQSCVRGSKWRQMSMCA